MPERQITQSWLLIYLTRDIQFSYETDFIEEGKREDVIRECTRNEKLRQLQEELK